MTVVTVTIVAGMPVKSMAPASAASFGRASQTGPQTNRQHGTESNHRDASI
jgi:hypothetical protein